MTLIIINKLFFELIFNIVLVIVNDFSSPLLVIYLSFLKIVLEVEILYENNWIERFKKNKIKLIIIMLVWSDWVASIIKYSNSFVYRVFVMVPNNDIMSHPKIIRTK